MKGKLATQYHALPFLLQNLPFLFSLKRSKTCYSYSRKSGKNITSNASLQLKQLKKTNIIAKIQDYVHCGLYKGPNVIVTWWKIGLLELKNWSPLRQKAPEPF